MLSDYSGQKLGSTVGESPSLSAGTQVHLSVQELTFGSGSARLFKGGRFAVHQMWFYVT